MPRHNPIQEINATIQKTVGDQVTPLHLSGYKTVDKELSDVYMGTADGRMIDGSGWIAPAGYDPRIRPWYTQASAANKLVFSDPFVDTDTKQMIISVAMPLQGENGRLKAVIAEDIQLSTLVNSIKQIN